MAEKPDYKKNAAFFIGESLLIGIVAFNIITAVGEQLVTFITALLATVLFWMALFKRLDNMMESYVGWMATKDGWNST